jgi:phosphoribosylamine--glycine ligase
VVGPEGPLAEGIVDKFQSHDMPIFGASKAAARIEYSKVFSKALMQKYHIPSAFSQSFSDYEEAKEYLQEQPLPVVIKADGLAAGKGVFIATSADEALESLNNVMKTKALGEAGNNIVIEEYLDGKELSVFAFTDGKTVSPLVPACDYKRVYDGDLGPNTGGMGSYSPPPFYDSSMGKSISDSIIKPTIDALNKEDALYKSILYGGLMLTGNEPKVLEFNARFGDPETQVILPRLQTDLVDIMQATVAGNLDKIDISWSEKACIGVVLASAGYPGSYKTGFPISGLNDLDEDVIVFHAGTKPIDGEVLTSGGRVLTVVATGKNLSEAREKVYNNVTRIRFEGCYYRNDIAKSIT